MSQTPAAESRRRSDTPITLTYSDGTEAERPPERAPAPNLEVSVTTEPPAPYKHGDVIRFWIVVGNKGDAPIPFARVSMQLGNLTIVNVNPTFPDACHELPCDLREIPPDANVSIFVRSRIGEENSFRTVITATPRPPDAVSADNTVTVEGEVEAEPPVNAGVPASADLSVDIEADPDQSRRSGDSVTYLVKIHNAGPQDATNIQVDLRGENMSLQKVTGACSQLPCTVPRIARDGDASLQVSATLGTAGFFRSQVRAISADDPEEANNTTSYEGEITTTTALRAKADLSVMLTEAPAESDQPGDIARFVFSVRNHGPDAATDVQITASSDDAAVLGITQACEVAPCTIAAGSSVAIELDTRPDAVGTFSGRLGVSATEQDPDPGNNSAPFAGEAAPASTEIPWIWIVAAVLGLIGAGTATNAIRKARWRRMIDVRSRLDTGGEISLSPIEPVIPIEIHVRVEPGETEASSIPVRDA